MLHGHVEALLDHGVLVGYVGSWAHNLIRAWLVDVAVESFILEPSLASVENDCVLEVFVARLAVGRRSASLYVLPGDHHVV